MNAAQTIDRDGVGTLVVKIGTSLLSGEEGFDGRVLEGLVKEMAELKQTRDMSILIVSSGAVGCGMSILGLKERPKVLPLKQATAAVGQSRLMHHYETMFQKHGRGLNTAQVLLTASDLDDRQRYLNVRNTIKALFDLKTVIPVVNENDSVATDELKFGDNDTLAARVAAKIDADLLIVLSDVNGLYDKNPARHKDAKLIARVDHVTEGLNAYADDTSAETSVGGMKTKLTAAKIACASGLDMVIANGRLSGVIHNVISGKGPMTTFCAAGNAISQRKRWIAFGRATRGTLVVDDGARDALIHRGKSLLAAGITAVRGSFQMGAAVHILDATDRPIARGLVNYSSEDIDRIKGHKSREIDAILQHKDFDEVIHRDNLVIL